jgi:hypothetical protein
MYVYTCGVCSLTVATKSHHVLRENPVSQLLFRVSIDNLCHVCVYAYLAYNISDASGMKSTHQGSERFNGTEQ